MYEVLLAMILFGVACTMLTQVTGTHRRIKERWVILIFSFVLRAFDVKFDW